MGKKLKFLDKKSTVRAEIFCCEEEENRREKDNHREEDTTIRSQTTFSNGIWVQRNWSSITVEVK
ncbi:hypothetical protein Dsin_013216 [Dipteronia sinensis]|uniref:Uncharacterized protein n=1 Tax=Dipteronia sinensis TaxID=43782 RepID=A0AAE0E8S6_9ROSI|nr:hypothetical protein Dsin_013216 [Dipteronia sinensis]